MINQNDFDYNLIIDNILASAKTLGNGAVIYRENELILILEKLGYVTVPVALSDVDKVSNILKDLGYYMASKLPGQV